MSAAVALAAGGARIGPNAITQVAHALAARHGPAGAARVFSLAGLSHYLADPPAEMVPEEDVTALSLALRGCLPERAARDVARDAGRATAEYLLDRRIPRAAQASLRVLPARLAARLLVAAIRRHAWTFAGSAAFEARTGRVVVLSLGDNPLCRGMAGSEPACDYFAATFERLFRALVHPGATVTEVECEAAGGCACRFEIRW